MCGFAGFISNNLSNNQDRHKILKMMGKSLLHRGPDQSGEFNYLKCGLSLVHQRLSILDTSKNGRQPMISPSGRFVLFLMEKSTITRKLKVRFKNLN